MINESTPLIKNINQNKLEKNEGYINKSENIYLNNKEKIIQKEEENNSIQIINPFDSITSNKIKLQSFSKNININNRYSQNSISNSLYNSKTFNNYNNFSYSKSINKENNSNDINFEIINNESNNINNENKKEQFKSIKESDEEEYNEENKNNLGEIYLEDLESYVDKYYNNINNKNYNTEYEINERISDIINNSPFENMNIVFKNKSNEVDIEKLININNIVYIKNLDNEQIIEKFNEDFYSQISPIKQFSNLNEILHTNIIEVNNISISHLYNYKGKNKDLIGKKIRDISSNDGNSFIKAFIFNYLENIITNSYLNRIIFIIYIISTKISLVQNTNLNIQVALSVLKIIYTHLKQNNIKESYIVLINAFKENSEFEKVLIFFVKYCIKQFIIDNHFLFNIEYLNELIIDKYVNTLNNQFDYELFIEEKISKENNELKYQIIIYYILPLIFDINLIIYTNNNFKSKIFRFKSNLKNDKKIINIELNIKFGNTSIIYNDSFYNKNKEIIPYINDISYIEKIKETNTCKKCGDENNNIFIKLNKKIKPLCEKCLINNIKKVINKRYIYLKQDLFLHEEFYCGKIKLTNALENNIFLSLNDIKIILPENKDINEEIYSYIINNEKCNKCLQVFKSKKYSICLKYCGHILCDECFIKYINEITHKRIILNKFELITEGLEYNCPCINCDNIIKKNNMGFLIYKYFDNLEFYIKQANERFVIQLKRFCCKCNKVSSEYFFDIDEKKHVLCSECKKFLENQRRLNDKRSVQTKFKCIFCDEKHNFNLIIFLRNNKEKNESCCIIV